MEEEIKQTDSPLRDDAFDVALPCRAENLSFDEDESLDIDVKLTERTVRGSKAENDIVMHIFDKDGNKKQMTVFHDTSIAVTPNENLTQTDVTISYKSKETERFDQTGVLDSDNDRLAKIADYVKRFGEFRKKTYLGVTAVFALLPDSKHSKFSGEYADGNRDALYETAEAFIEQMASEYVGRKFEFIWFDQEKETRYEYPSVVEVGGYAVTEPLSITDLYTLRGVARKLTEKFGSLGTKSSYCNVSFYKIEEGKFSYMEEW